jgi:hypothetical protein
MDKENVLCLYNGILCGHKKEENPDICNNLEDIMPSEISQT